MCNQDASNDPRFVFNPSRRSILNHYSPDMNTISTRTQHQSQEEMAHLRESDDNFTVIIHTENVEASMPGGGTTSRRRQSPRMTSRGQDVPTTAKVNGGSNYSGSTTNTATTTTTTTTTNNNNNANGRNTPKALLHGQFYRTRMCPYLNRAEVGCKRRDACSYAHSEDQLRGTVDLTKTKLCQRFERTGKCPKYPCRFAHGLEDLRSTMHCYKTQFCRKFVSTGLCPSGYYCRHAHGEEEVRLVERLRDEGKLTAQIKLIHFKNFLESFGEELPLTSICEDTPAPTSITRQKQASYRSHMSQDDSLSLDDLNSLSVSRPSRAHRSELHHRSGRRITDQSTSTSDHIPGYPYDAMTSTLPYQSTFDMHQTVASRTSSLTSMYHTAKSNEATFDNNVHALQSLLSMDVPNHSWGQSRPHVKPNNPFMPFTSGNRTMGSARAFQTPSSMNNGGTTGSSPIQSDFDNVSGRQAQTPSITTVFPPHSSVYEYTLGDYEGGPESAMAITSSFMGSPASVGSSGASNHNHHSSIQSRPRQQHKRYSDLMMRQRSRGLVTDTSYHPMFVTQFTSFDNQQQIGGTMSAGFRHVTGSTSKMNGHPGFDPHGGSNTQSLSTEVASMELYTSPFPSAPGSMEVPLDRASPPAPPVVNASTPVPQGFGKIAPLSQAPGFGMYWKPSAHSNVNRSVDLHNPIQYPH